MVTVFDNIKDTLQLEREILMLHRGRLGRGINMLCAPIRAGIGTTGILVQIIAYEITSQSVGSRVAIGSKNRGQFLVILANVEEYLFECRHLIESQGGMPLAETMHETVEILVRDGRHALHSFVPIANHHFVVIDVPGE